MTDTAALWTGSRRSRLLAWTLAGVGVLGFSTLLVANLVQDGWGGLGADAISGVLDVLFFVGLGTLLALRQPANAIGWLLTAGGLTSLLQRVTGGVAERAVTSGHVTVADRLAAAVESNLWPVAVLCSIGLPLLLFPSGRLRSRGSRLLLGVMLAAGLLLLATFALTPGPLVDPTGTSALVVNPTGVDGLGSLTTVTTNLGLPVFMLSMLSAVAGVIARFRSATGIERQQLRWVLVGAALALCGILIVYVGGFLLGLSPAVASVAVTVGTGCLPVAFTVAILRYRLYDLDRVVSRTVTYAALSGLLVATYVGLVTAVSRLTPSSSSLSVAASTLAVAALFQPLRRRVQAVVDQRFNRARYDAARTVEAFSLRLREEVDLEAVRDDLLAVVRLTLQPASTTLWLRDTRGAAS